MIAVSKRLTCGDSTNGDFDPTGSLMAGDVVFENFVNPGGRPPLTVADLNMGGAGPMAAWHFLKVVLYVKPKITGMFTITVISADQALAWVPSDKWGTTNLDISQWASRSITINGCGERTSTRYFGGILASDPNACIRLTVSESGGTSTKVQRRLNGDSCIG
ncbi:MAG: hypothetical protein M3Z00_11560 [Actinomycetota bacterium]|nr:hypothetical protein [Actinomycetota bacterium]